MKEEKSFIKKFYIKVKDMYVEKVGVSNVTFSQKDFHAVSGKLYDDDKQEMESVIGENISFIIERLVKMGYKREDITVEVKTETTVVETEKVKVVEEKVEGKKVYSFEKPEKPHLKIGKGSVTIIDDNSEITFYDALSAPSILINPVPLTINTTPPNIHPNTEELDVYDIVRFKTSMPHMNIASGDMAVVVNVSSSHTVVVKKDGSQFPIGRQHVYRVRN